MGEKTDGTDRKVRPALLSALQLIIVRAKGFWHALSRLPGLDFRWIRRQSLAASHSFWYFVEHLGQSLAEYLKFLILSPLHRLPKTTIRLIIRFWAFLGRCGIALRRILTVIFWRPLVKISTPLAPIFRPVWAFLGRCGIALRRILTVLVWRPLYFISSPLRWLYRRVLRKPLSFAFLSLRTFAEWLLVDLLWSGIKSVPKIPAALASFLESISQRLPHRRSRLRDRLDTYGQRGGRSDSRFDNLNWAGTLRPSSVRGRVNRWTTAAVTTGVLLLLGYLSSQGSVPTNVQARNSNLAGTPPPALAALVPKMTLTPTVIPSPTATLTPVPSPTPIPADDLQPWPTPDPLGNGGTLAFTQRWNGNEDIYALSLGRSEPIRLTGHPAADRDPAWSADGRKLAFSSHRDGNWELYVLDLAGGELRRLTQHHAFDGSPSWSPDGQWLVFESNRDGNLDLYIIDAAANNPPIRLTESPAQDFSPAWSPDGRHIAYTSRRQGSKDIFILNLDTATDELTFNVTASPEQDEDNPAWDPSGRYLAYDSQEAGLDIVFAQRLADFEPEGSAFTIGRGKEANWAADGQSLVFLHQTADRSFVVAGGLDSWSPAPQAYAGDGLLADLVWSAGSLPRGLEERLPLVISEDRPLFVEEESSPQESGPSFLLREIDVDAPAPYLSDKVDGSFLALRERVAADVGWDFLGALDNMFAFLSTRPFPGESDESWSKAARSFDFYLRYPISIDPQVEIVREDIGPETYWRVYLRPVVQDGSIGEPLRDLPWDFTARYDSDPRYYDEGGKFKESIPEGYYLDFTTLAADYGWTRVPALENWRTFFQGIQYWHFENRQGLSWQEAILELYTADEVEQLLEN
jgi:TolB protein